MAAAVVAHTLGLDGADDAVVDDLLRWYGAIVDSVAGVAAGRSVTSAGAAAMSELQHSLEPVISGPSGASLLADAVHAGGLSADDVVADAAVIMFGGIETTEGMILNAIWHVLQDEQVRDELVSRPRPGPRRHRGVIAPGAGGRRRRPLRHS